MATKSHKKHKRGAGAGMRWGPLLVRRQDTAGGLTLCCVGGLVPKRDGHGEAMRDERSEAQRGATDG